MNGNPDPNNGYSILTDEAAAQMTRAFVGEASHYLAQIKRQAIRKAMDNDEMHRWRSYLPATIFALEDTIRALNRLVPPETDADPDE